MFYVSRSSGSLISISKLLLQNGADVKIKDKFGRTPLAKAIQNGDFLYAQTLVSGKMISNSNSNKDIKVRLLNKRQPFGDISINKRQFKNKTIEQILIVMVAIQKAIFGHGDNSRLRQIFSII